jgi:serine/threonine protein kinase
MNDDTASKQRASELGDLALDIIAGPDREAFIDETCGADGVLKSLVRAYVDRAESSHPLFDESTVTEGGPEEPYARHLGTHIGPWTLLKVVGEGGAGVVFLVERKNPIKKAAIKLLKGTVPSHDLEIRFRHEHQALAKLDHPNIVRFLDAGVTDDEQAYVVMEYIEDAKPIDVYCRDKALTVRETIKLFKMVCEAVSEAHQNKIIHRDLKPGNILVGENGIPKLVDFNLAKLLDPADQGAEIARSTRVQIGTARYMSPEQALCKASYNTTDIYATDIYALGIVLYELLTGTDPYDFERRGKESVAVIISEVDPQPASQAIQRSATRSADKKVDLNAVRRLRRELSGDLDTILKMALRKEPERRYQSVDAFRGDLQRYLDRQPVTARGDSPGYRAQRFVLRHLVWAISFILLSFTLMVGFVITSSERNRANKEAASAMVLRKMVSTIAKERGPNIPKNGIRPIPGHAPMYEAVARVLVGPGVDYVDSPWPPCEVKAGEPTPLAQLKTGASLFTTMANLHRSLHLVATVSGDPDLNLGDNLAFLLHPDPTAPCQPVALVLPVGSKIEGAHYFAIEATGSAANRCMYDDNHRFLCSLDDSGGTVHHIQQGVDWCGWDTVLDDRIDTTVTESDQVVGAVFKNWSDRTRVAVLSVVFTPPAGWLPQR